MNECCTPKKAVDQQLLRQFVMTDTKSKENLNENVLFVALDTQLNSLSEIRKSEVLYINQHMPILTTP